MLIYKEDILQGVKAINLVDIDRKGISKGYIEIIQEMYKSATMNVRTVYEAISEFFAGVGFHQGSTLWPNLPSLILNYLKRIVSKVRMVLVVCR